MAPQQLRSATENVATVLLLYSIWQYNEEYTGVDGNSFAYMYTSFHSFLPKVDRYTWTDHCVLVFILNENEGLRHFNEVILKVWLLSPHCE